MQLWYITDSDILKCVNLFILKNTNIFEINTGAMAKSYRTSPYPSKEILNIIYKNNGEIMINSDCHKKEQLDFAFDTAVNIAKEVGFKEHIIFTNNGKEKVDL